MELPKDELDKKAKIKEESEIDYGNVYVDLNSHQNSDQF